MAALPCCCSKSFTCFSSALSSKASFLKPFQVGVALLAQRNASKKAGGSCKSQGKSSNPKYWGRKVNHGQRVTAGTNLVRQMGYKYHPGWNVAVGRDQTLYSLVEGIVQIRHEFLEHRRGLDRTKGMHERKFIHVVEKEKPRRMVPTSTTERPIPIHPKTGKPRYSEKLNHERVW